MAYSFLYLFWHRPESRRKNVAAVAQQTNKWLAAGPVESVVVQVPRALLVSVLAAAIDCAILFFLVDLIGWNRVPAAVIGYLAGSVVQYVLCSLWVFPGASQSVATGFLTFTVLSLVGLVITWIVMALLASVHLSFTKMVALGLAFAWNFLSRKYLLFRPQPRQA
jgi:putative flippase GtrA